MSGLSGEERARLEGLAAVIRDDLLYDEQACNEGKLSRAHYSRVAAAHRTSTEGPTRVSEDDLAVAEKFRRTMRAANRQHEVEAMDRIIAALTRDESSTEGGARVDCPKCDGDGYGWFDDPDLALETGTMPGYHPREECPWCHGEGHLQVVPASPSPTEQEGER